MTRRPARRALRRLLERSEVPQNKDVIEIRVLHVIAALSGGGAQNFICTLVPELRRQGIEAGILTVYDSDVPPAPSLASTPIFSAHRSGRYDVASFARMIRIIRAYQPHIVHTHMHNGKYAGRLAAIIAGVPVIVHTDHLPANEDRNALEKHLDSALSHFTSRYIVFLNMQREQLARRENVPVERVEAILNGVAFDDPPSRQTRAALRAELALRDDDFAVFVVGRLCRQKNQHLAIRAIAQLPPSTRARVKLIVVGAGPDETMLRALAAELAPEAVVFTGFRLDAPKLFAAADLTLMPSLFEGMPLALIESMGAGVPIMTTPWSGASELLRGGELGIILPDFDSQTCASALNDLVVKPALLEDTIQKAYDVARTQYNIVETARSHIALYDGVAVSRASTSGRLLQAFARRRA